MPNTLCVLLWVLVSVLVYVLLTCNSAVRSAFWAVPVQQLPSACRACWDEMLGLGWISVTAGNQSHVGICSALVVWRPYPVKVSVPDYNSLGSFGPRMHQEMARLDSFFFSDTAAVWVHFVFYLLLAAKKKALVDKGVVSGPLEKVGRLSVYSYRVHSLSASGITIRLPGSSVSYRVMQQMFRGRFACLCAVLQEICALRWRGSSLSLLLFKLINKNKVSLEAEAGKGQNQVNTAGSRIREARAPMRPLTLQLQLGFYS